MSGITEKTNEQSLLRWLDDLEWEVYGDESHMASGGVLINDVFDRDTDDMLLWKKTSAKIIDLNPSVDTDNVDRVISKLKKELSNSRTKPLVEANKDMYEILTGGLPFTDTSTENTITESTITLIDVDQLQENSFIAANQVRFKSNGNVIIPDTTLFINGFPIAHCELKSSGQGNTVEDAVRNFTDVYEQRVPEAFHTALFNVVSETLEYGIGAVGSPQKHYYPWKRALPEHATQGDIDGFKQGVRATLNRDTLFNILQNYVFYEKTPHGRAKITPRYMQYYATESILDRIRTGHNDGRQTSGLIWHTQGSGKTITMLYTADRLLKASWFASPQILILVDSDDLREQLELKFRSIGRSSSFEVASSMAHLEKMIRNGGSKIIVSTIQMFEEVSTDIQTNSNTVILADEAHRYMEKQLGNRLEGALPNVHHYGFTGTPVSDAVRNTFKNYSNNLEDSEESGYLDRYSIKQGIEDDVILPVHFDVRTDIGWQVNDIDLDKEFNQLVEGLSEQEKKEVIEETMSGEDLSELEPRVQAISEDIYNHYESKIEPSGWKAMVVTPSRKAAIKYGTQLQSVSSDPNDIRVLISDPPQDESGSSLLVPESDHNTVINDFKKDGSPKILVVCDKLLTGFDAPVLKAMYLDRNLQDHNLLQAVARVNRPADGKHNGLIVDYIGALSNLEEALTYSDEIVEEDIIAEEGELMQNFIETLDECEGLFDSQLDPEQITGQEDITGLVAEVAKRAEQFKEKIERLQNIYESLSPHGDLVDYEDRYQLLNQIRLDLQRHENQGDEGEILTRRQQWGEKTRELLEDDDIIQFNVIGEKYPTFELNSDSLDEISDIPDDINIIRIGAGLQEIIERERESNPRYERLSERLKTLLERWHGDMIDATETLATLERIKSHVEDIEDREENVEMNDAEYAIYLLLIDEYQHEIPSEERAKTLAKEIEIQFQDNVNRDFVGWTANPDTHKEIKDSIYEALTETNLYDLYGNEEFFAQCTQYLVENHQ